MHEDPEMQSSQARTQDEAVGEILYKLGQIFAEREAADAPPEAEQPRDPWVDKSLDKPGPLIAAEKEVWLSGIVEKLQLAWCKRPGGCRLGRCKRSGRCAEIDKMRPDIERSRAALANAQARWPQPAGLAEPPVRRRRRREEGKPPDTEPDGHCDNQTGGRRAARLHAKVKPPSAVRILTRIA